MYKVAFYIDNRRIANVDCAQIEDGNPGIGGTEYLFYFTVFNLQVRYRSLMSIMLLTSCDVKLPAMEYEVVGSKQEAITYCIKQGYNILVIKYEEADYISKTLLSHDNVRFLKIVVWAHNVIPNHILTRMESLGGISAIVNVGREQLDLYRDHNMFYKSTFIYNSLPIRDFAYYQKKSEPFQKRGHVVTYLGSLVPVKGFHVLAKIWKDILKEIPDAHLNVIGSGQVYNTNAKLGPYGIAEESYEREFMPYLVDEHGKILDSVTFWGKLGKEKEKILARTKVGVPNPAGTTETFCLSAIEMALWGARIVSRKYVGLIDTVKPELGVLFSSEKNFKKLLIQELLSTNDQHKLAWGYIYQHYSSDVIDRSWFSFFMDLLNRTSFYSNISPINSHYNLKNIREINRRLKKILPFGDRLPTVDTYISAICLLFRIKTTTPIIKY